MHMKRKSCGPSLLCGTFILSASIGNVLSTDVFTGLSKIVLNQTDKLS